MVNIAVDRALEMFGLQEPIDEKTVVDTYRQLAMLYHPDRLSESPAATRAIAEQQMARLNAARDTILHALRGGTGSQPSGVYTRPQTAPPQPSPPRVRFVPPMAQPPPGDGVKPEVWWDVVLRLLGVGLFLLVMAVLNGWVHPGLPHHHPHPRSVASVTPAARLAFRAKVEAVVSDFSQLESVATANDSAAVVAACRRLGDDANAAMWAIPPEYSDVAPNLAVGYTGYMFGADSCERGVTTNDSALIERARAQFANADAEISTATAKLRAAGVGPS